MMNTMYPSRTLRGLRDALTPQVQTFGSPQPAPGPTVQSTQPPVGTMPKYACPSGFIPYASYIDPAGNYEYSGCMLPSNQTLAPGGTTTQGGTSSLNPTAGGPGSSQGTAVTQGSPGPNGTCPPGYYLSTGDAFPGSCLQGSINPNTPPTSVVALAPNTPGVLPGGQGTISNATAQLNGIYRFILPMGGGYATGASRAGCSQTNSGACDPQFFSTLQQAIQYALRNGEIPYQVFQASDPWAIINGTQAINPAQVYNADGSLGGGSLSIGTLALLAVGLWFLSGR